VDLPSGSKLPPVSLKSLRSAVTFPGKFDGAESQMGQGHPPEHAAVAKVGGLVVGVRRTRIIQLLMISQQPISPL
jgi:hypothetical protein